MAAAAEVAAAAEAAVAAAAAAGKEVRGGVAHLHLQLDKVRARCNRATPQNMPTHGAVSLGCLLSHRSVRKIVTHKMAKEEGRPLANLLGADRARRRDHRALV